MTPTQTVMTPAAHERCGCGCMDCRGECCKLDCLTRPNFFSGQLLTDVDLKSLVDWIQSKSALQRFREGWGVVCGLEVTCSHKHKEQSRVYVSEGYAVDCCGRDIVVCDPIWYDFKCEEPFDPCCREPEPTLQPPYRDKDNKPGREVPHLGCIPLSELRAFELCLLFDEQMRAGQRAMVRGNCYPMDDCQFTRVKEKGKLVATEITDPCAQQPARFEDKYRRDLKMFLDELGKYKSSARTLLEYVSGKLDSFCFVEECLCEIVEKERDKPGKTRLGPDWIFYIVQDWRNHYLQCLCESCKGTVCEDAGVPLARVWVWNKQKDDCRVCKVVYIDSYPPYRRHLARDCWSSYPGCVDLSRYIWREVDEVKQQLCEEGFSNVSIAEFDRGSVEGLASHPEKDLICAPCGSALTVRTYADLCGRQRVVTFEGGGAA